MPGQEDHVAGNVQSPCVGSCCLDGENICLGCFRSCEEIVHWWVATDDERREILAMAQIRRGSRQARVLNTVPNGEGDQ